MSKKRLLVTTVGTVGCAFGIGYFMQLDNAPKPTPVPAAVEISAAPVQDAPALVEDTGAVTAEMPVVETEDAQVQSEPAVNLDAITLTSIDVTPVLKSITASLLETVALEDPAPEVENQAATVDPLEPFTGCDLRVSAEAADMAFVRLSVEAPCNANDRVTIHHTGMMFSKVTSTGGRVDVDIPALSQTGVFIVELENGEGAVAMVDVPELENFDRVALQWAGSGGFQIHAREFGAAYGTSGHVWSGSDMSSGGGRLVRLGDMDGLLPNIVEVYTYPKGQAPRDGVVTLSVEAEVTENNCGRDIAAQSIELRDSERLKTRDLVLTMPDCSAVGDFLVLNNLMDDLKIAAR